MGTCMVMFGARPDERIEARVLAGVLERLKGLLFSDGGCGAVLLERCGSIHTFGMRFVIDVALGSREGEVVRSERCVGPGRVVRSRRARWVLERPASNAPWPAAGMQGERSDAEGTAAGAIGR